MNENTSLEFISEEIKAAINQLDAITGRNIDEDLLNRIFSEFCIGEVAIHPARLFGFNLFFPASADKSRTFHIPRPKPPGIPSTTKDLAKNEISRFAKILNCAEAIIASMNYVTQDKFIFCDYTYL